MLVQNRLSERLRLQILITGQVRHEGSSGPYDQILLFGDSITQQSCSQDNGFALTPALQNGMFMISEDRNLVLRHQFSVFILG